jgi:hypothetical protein
MSAPIVARVGPRSVPVIRALAAPRTTSRGAGAGTSPTAGTGSAGGPRRRPR